MGLSPPLEKIYHSFFIYLLFSGTEKRKKYSFPFLALCVAGQRIPRRRRCYEQGSREDFWRARARPRGPLLCQPSRRCAFRKLRLERGTSDLLHVPLPSEPAVYDFISTLVKCSLKKLPASVYV